jgi:hypothetical protein
MVHLALHLLDVELGYSSWAMLAAASSSGKPSSLCTSDAKYSSGVGTASFIGMPLPPLQRRNRLRRRNPPTHSTAKQQRRRRHQQGQQASTLQAVGTHGQPGKMV